MSAFLLTALASLLCLICLFWFIRRRELMYRTNEEKMLCILHLVLSRQASERDWNIFEALPMRQNLELEFIRRECIEVAEIEYIGNPYNLAGKALFTERGLMLLERLARRAEQAKTRF